MENTTAHEDYGVFGISGRVALRAPFFLSQAVLPAMVRKNWGRIVSIGGTDAYRK